MAIAVVADYAFGFVVWGRGLKKLGLDVRSMAASLISALHRSLTTMLTASDADWLRSLVWERSAPTDLVQAAASGDPVRFGRAWRARLRDLCLRRGAPRDLQTAWSCPRDRQDDFGRAVATIGLRGTSRRAQRSAIKSATTWAARVQPLVKMLATADRTEAFSPLELLAGFELLATASATLPHKLWWPLFRHMLSASLSDASLSHADASESIDETLLRTGELPWCAGVLFADLAGAADLRKQGRRALRKELAARTDSDGTPHGEITARLPLWLAPLVRALLWSESFGAELWSHEEGQLLSDTCERSIALCRADGRLALTNGLALDPLPVFAAAAELFHWTPANPTLTCLRSLQRRAAGEHSKTTPQRVALSVMPSNQSDWSRFAVLRSDWSAAADTVAITHHQAVPQLDVALSGEPMLHGLWDLRLRIGDAQIELAEEWSCVCWESDPDADYIELQMAGPGRLRVERLILLSRAEKMLMLADSISGVKGERINYCMRLPLAAGVTATAETASRSVRLQGPRLKARLFPLALPQDRVHSTPHQCTVDDAGVTLEQVAEGHGLFAPLVIEWHPERRNKPADWRQLTVTEDLQILRPDVASGHRLRVGGAQWLFYRSLKSTGQSRSVLGHHTFNETVIARFDANGDVDPLLMIEGDA